MMKHIHPFLMISIICTLLSGCANKAVSERSGDWSDNWPNLRGANYDGISEEAFEWPAQGPKEVWRTNVGVGHSALSVVDGIAYTMSNIDENDLVICLDARTGKEIWRYSYPCRANYFSAKPFDGPGATPTIYKDAVYTFSRSGHAVALNAKTGALIWKRDLAEEEGCARPDWGFAGSVLVDGERLIYNATTGGVCLDRKTGKTLWKIGEGQGGYSTPVPVMTGGKKYAAIFGTQTLTVVDPVDGSIFWETARKQPIGLNAADPVIEGSKIFVSAGRRSGGAVYDISGGTEPLWDNRNMNNHWQSCVLWKGYLYGCEGNNAAGAGRSPISLRCLDWKTGEIVWENDDIDFFGLIVVDNKLLMITNDGDLIVAEASPMGYKELGRATVIDPNCFAAPVLSNGYVFLRNTEGDIVCLDMRS